MTTHVAEQPLTAPDARPVFISYSSKDAGAAAQVCDHLESAGLRCWMAPRDVPTGLLYADVIVRAMDGARLVVLVFSQAANDSTPVRNEVELAAHRGLAILPVIVEAVTPSEGMEYYLRSRHWKNAVKGALSDSLRQLEADVRLHLSRNPQWDTPRRLWRRLMTRVGGGTLVVSGVVALLAIQLVVVRASLAPAERGLGFYGLAIALAVWLIAGFGGFFNRRRGVIAIKAGVGALLIGGWITAAVLTHRLPAFSTTAPGILVARISGDGDRQQRLVAQLADFAETSGGVGEDPVEVRALPRRVASSEQAHRLADETGALVTVWGDVVSSRLRARVTMGDGEGIYDSPGPVIASSDLEVDDTAAHVENVLVNFLAAYQRYQKKDYAAALDRFERTRALLESDPDAVIPGRLTPVEATLATIHFYVATSRYQLRLTGRGEGGGDKVLEDYRAAMSYAAKSGTVSGFATPVANLAGILLSSGRAGDRDQAEAALDRTACDVKVAFAPIPCLYIQYHRAVLDNYRGRYAKGLERLDDLLNVSWPALAREHGSRSPHQLLVPFAFKNRAYARTRIADTAPAMSTAMYQQADGDWREAERQFAVLKHQPPADFLLTRARIDIGLRRPDEARQALAAARARKLDDPDLQLVTITIAECEGRGESTAGERGLYMMRLRTELADHRSEYERVKREADRQWTAFAGLCSRESK